MRLAITPPWYAHNIVIARLRRVAATVGDQSRASPPGPVGAPGPS